MITDHLTPEELTLVMDAVSHANKVLPATVAEVLVAKLVMQEPSRWVVESQLLPLAKDVLSIEGGGS